MLYLLMLTHLRFKPATIVVTSELPLGSGLGSSVALCVAFSAALFACSDCVHVDMKQGWLIFGGVQGFQINQIILTNCSIFVEIGIWKMAAAAARTEALKN